MSCFKGRGFSFPLNEKTYIMGILNVTEDSFFDGGKYNTPEKALERALQMQNDGADIIDLGAQSTRPESVYKTPEQEIEILTPVLNALGGKISVPISVDTFHPKVAEYALMNGVSIINDVSGVFNEETTGLVKKYNAGWIIMHTGGGSASAQINYDQKVVESVIDFFSDMKKKCTDFGISNEQLMFDMGIGFGKGYKDNLTLLKNINRLKTEDTALLTALSCKRIIKESSGCEGDDLLFGTIAANTVAIAGGTDFIRVHHVKEAALAAKTADAIYRR